MSEPRRHLGPVAAARRVRLIALHALGEALHLRLTLLLALMGAALVLGAHRLRYFNFGATELKFIADFGLGAMGLFGTLLAALVTAQLFFKELETRAAYCVLTRPVRRWEYVAGKFVGVAGMLALFVVALGGLLAVLLVWREEQLGGPPLSLGVFLGACALQWFKITLVAAMTLLVCSYAGSSLFASCSGLLLAVAAHLRGLTGGTEAGWWHLWPDLSLYDAEAVLATGRMPGLGWLLGVGSYWAVYSFVLVVLAAYVFKHREL